MQHLKLKDRKRIVEDIRIANEELDKIFSKLAEDRLHKISYILSLDEITYLYLINEVVKETCEDKTISKNQGMEIKKVLKSEKPNVLSRISKDLYLVKTYDTFHFTNSAPTKSNYEFLISKHEVVDTEFFYLDLTVDCSNRNIYDISFPITIRNAKNGDTYIINGYQVEVRRLFIDWKMPTFIRKFWPVILDKNGIIIYIPRYQKEFKADKNTNFYVKIV